MPDVDMFQPLDVQLQDAWGDVLSGPPASKRHRSEQSQSPPPRQADKEKQKEKGKEKDQKRRDSSRAKGSASSGAEESLVRQLSRLVLQQQEQLQATLRSTSYVIHLGRGADGVVEHMLRATRRWKECLLEDATSIKEPLRVVLLKSLMSSLLLRHTELLKRIRIKRGIDKCAQQGQVLLRADVGSRSRAIDHGLSWQDFELRGDEQAVSGDCQVVVTHFGGASQSTEANKQAPSDSNIAISCDLFRGNKRGNASPHCFASIVTDELLGPDRWEHEGREGESTTIGREDSQADLRGLDCDQRVVPEAVADVDLPRRDLLPRHGLLRHCCLLRAGMINEDNVCYANCVLACFACIASIVPDFIPELSDTIGQAISTLLATDPPFQPVHLVRQFPNLFLGWNVGDHEDAYEYVQHLLGASEVDVLVHTYQVTRWNISGRVVVEQQRQHVLTLSFMDTSAGATAKTNEVSAMQHSLSGMLANWSAPVEEEGEWHRSQSSLATGPQVLILHLQRFAIHGGIIRKNTCAVTFETHLDIPLVTGELVRYRVVSVLAHHGQEANAGHYTSYVLLDDDDDDDDAGYIRCDDVTLRPRAISENLLAGVVSRDAYMYLLCRM